MCPQTNFLIIVYNFMAEIMSQSHRELIDSAATIPSILILSRKSAKN
jgi:rRNA-processing protein FCF1